MKTVISRTRGQRRDSAAWAVGLATLLAIAGLACEAGNPSGAEREPGALEPQSEAGVDARRGLSADAKLETEAMLREDVATARDPSDGGGRAWLTSESGGHTAGSSQRLELVFETGPMGIAEGGAILLQPSPFWEWDDPQTSFPDAPGFTEVTDLPPGVDLDLDDHTPGMLVAWVEDRALEPGETLRFVYGAGPRGARVDRYAEDQTPIYLAVDGNGDGVRSFIEQSPRLDIVGGPPRRIQPVAPRTAP